MKNFIEELFYGNIDPQARGYTKDSNICDNHTGQCIAEKYIGFAV